GSSAELGWVVSAYLLGYAAAVLVVLPLTDRIRPSRVIAIGALVTALANIGFAFAAHDVITASALRVIAGFGLAGVYMPGVRLVAQSSDPARRGTAVGLYVAAFYLGGSLSFLATGLLLEPVGWRGAAVILGAVALAAVPGVFVGGWLSDRVGRLRAALLYALASGAISVGFGTLLFAPWPAIVAIGGMYGALVAADSAVYSTAVTELAPAARIGSAQALQAAAGFGIGSLGPVA